MVILLAEYWAPSLPKTLKHDSHSTPMTSIFMNNSSHQNNKLAVHPDCDIEVENVCSADDEDDFVSQPKHLRLL